MVYRSTFLQSIMIIIVLGNMQQKKTKMLSRVTVTLTLQTLQNPPRLLRHLKSEVREQRLERRITRLTYSKANAAMRMKTMAKDANSDLNLHSHSMTKLSGWLRYCFWSLYQRSFHHLFNFAKSKIVNLNHKRSLF